MTRLGCIADLHLGKPAGYPGRLEEQRDVVIAAFERFNEERVDAVLIAGDIFEGPVPTPEHYQAFNTALTVLDDRISVVAVLGNGRHDAAMRATSAPKVLAGPYDFYDTPDLYPLGMVTVSCLPWAPVNRLVASSNGGDRDAINEQAARHLLTIARGLREQIPSDCASVLLTHFGISGGADGLERFAREPILPLEELAELGYDAVISGHLHRGEVYSEDPLILMCGSPFPLDHGEGGYPHGAWIVDVAPGRAKARFVPLASRPFVTYDIHPDQAALISSSGAWPNEEPDAPVARVRYTATREQASRIDNAAIVRALLDAGAFRAEVEPTILPDQRARVVVDEHADPTDAVGLYLDALDADDGVKRAMREQHDAYAEEVGT